MARTYWIRGPVTAAQEDSLHAQMLMDLVIGNAEAVYETAVWDTCIVQPDYTVPSGTGVVLAGGPYWVPVHFDRDGQLRDLAVQVLCCSGAGGALTWYVVATQTYREPDLSGTTTDPNVSQSVAAGTTVDWQAEQTLVLPEHWTAVYPRLWPDSSGEDPVRIQGVWLSAWVDSPAADTYYAGLRVREEVDVS